MGDILWDSVITDHDQSFIKLFTIDLFHKFEEKKKDTSTNANNNLFYSHFFPPNKHIILSYLMKIMY